MKLAWTNPAPPEHPSDERARLTLVPAAAPRPPRPRVNLAVAIASHLAGGDGLSDDEFAILFATGRASGEQLRS
jgi:hypothetical protein